MTQTVTITKMIGGEPVREFLLMPFGYVEVERALAGSSFTFSRRQAAQVVAWFARTGRKLAIDYEHQSLPEYSKRADGLSPAAGWIGRLEIRADGLWARDVHWTEQARSMLAAGEYRYFSPVIHWRDESYTEIDSLGPVALTNDPAMRGVPALAAVRERDHMYATVLAARPLPGVFIAGGGEARSKAQIIRAIEAFAQNVDIESFNAAVSEELVTTVLEGFGGDDQEVLRRLAYIIEQAGLGSTPRELAGQLMTLPEPPADVSEQTAYRRQLSAKRASRSEFDSPETEAAYLRAERAGLVRIYGKTPAAAAAASRTTVSTTHRTAVTDASLETQWQSSAQLRNEFRNDKATFFAFARAEARGQVRILRRSGR